MFDKLKKKLSLMRRKTITREIDGQSFTFHPVTIQLFFDLKTVLEPMWIAIQNLVVKKDSDVTNTIEHLKRPDGSIEQTTHIGQITPEMAKFRADRADSAARACVEALLSGESRLGVGRVFADLLRSDFGPNPSDDDVIEFMNDLDLPMTFELLGGFLEVNASMLAPFMGRIQAFAKERFGVSLSQSEPNQEQPEKKGPKLSPSSNENEMPPKESPAPTQI